MAMGYLELALMSQETKVSCLTALPCLAAERSARLRHSWLENQVITKNAQDVVYLWRTLGWEALARFPERIDEVLDFAEDLTRGFSPAQLACALGPLRELKKNEREIVQETLHLAYLEVFPAAERAEEIVKAGSRLGESSGALQELWSMSPTDDLESAVAQAWERVRADAEVLLGALRRLPEGIVLP